MAQKTFIKDKLVFYEQVWALLGDLRVGVFTVDAHRKITSFNRAAELLTGYDEEDVIWKDCGHQSGLDKTGG